jgi:hypothetical protein
MTQSKKINRNAFNEKLIHRYLFEKYYFSQKKERNFLLPKKYHSKEINLIVPEDNKNESKYRADLTIYFKNYHEGVPVEVKWHIKNFTKENQFSYIKKHNGFCISFEDIDSDKYKGLDYIKINHNDFQNWVCLNISKLTRESLIYQANIEEISASNQHWLVFLRGTSHTNFKKMLNDFPKNSFWAYTNNYKSLKNIFDIQQGDLCLFLLGNAKEGMGVSNNPNLNLDYYKWYITKIKEPYYMALDDQKGVFFEKENPPINKRRWPHFVDFEIIEKLESDKKINFGKREDIAKAIADSYNYGKGAPVPLLRKDWDSLIDKLRSQTF